LQNWGDFEENFCEVEVIDGFFIATQYDIDWRTEFKTFSGAAIKSLLQSRTSLSFCSSQMI